MEKKLLKMQSTCKWMYSVSRVFFVFNFIAILFICISTVMGIILPNEALIVEKMNDGWSVRSE